MLSATHSMVSSVDYPIGGKIYQLAAGLMSTYLQTEVNDNAASSGLTYSQPFVAFETEITTANS